MRQQLRSFLDSHAGADVLGMVLLLPLAAVLYGWLLGLWEAGAIAGVDWWLHWPTATFYPTELATDGRYLIVAVYMVAAGWAVLAVLMASLQWVNGGRFGMAGWWRRARGPELWVPPATTIVAVARYGDDGPSCVVLDSDPDALYAVILPRQGGKPVRRVPVRKLEIIEAIAFGAVRSHHGTSS